MARCPGGCASVPVASYAQRVIKHDMTIKCVPRCAKCLTVTMLTLFPCQIRHEWNNLLHCERLCHRQQPDQLLGMGLHGQRFNVAQIWLLPKGDPGHRGHLDLPRRLHRCAAVVTECRRVCPMPIRVLEIVPPRLVLVTTHVACNAQCNDTKQPSHSCMQFVTYYPFDRRPILRRRVRRPRIATRMWPWRQQYQASP